MDLSTTNLFIGICFVSTPYLFYFGNKMLNTHSSVLNTHLNVLDIHSTVLDTHANVLEMKKRLIQADVDSTVYSLDELHKLKKLQLDIKHIDSKLNALTQKTDCFSEKLINVDSINSKVDALTQTTNSFSEKLMETHINMSQLMSYISNNEEKLSLVKTKVFSTVQSMPYEAVSFLIKAALASSGKFDLESCEVLGDLMQNTIDVIKATPL